MPNLPIWYVSLALIVVLVAAWVLGAVARFLLRGRAHVAPSASIVSSMLGSSAGLFVAWLIRPDVTLRQPLAVLAALGGSVVAVAIWACIAAHFQKPQPPGIAQLVASGESDRVEFKSTARVNTHTGAKDDRMELVVAKTIAAFLNADGGTLIIGVDDAGNPLGLDRDLATMKAPDHDRFELWLRDLLVSSLGPNAAGLVSVEFHELPDAENTPRAVCRVTASSSPRPVYLRFGKNASPELWVRTGNSTRQLPVDAAADYIQQRWPLAMGAGVAAQFRAAARFSGSR